MSIPVRLPSPRRLQLPAKCQWAKLARGQV